MTDKLIATDGTSSGLSAGAAISDTDYLEIQQSVVSPASTVNSQFSAVKTWVKSWIAKADVGLSNVTNAAQFAISNNLSEGTAASMRANLGFNQPSRLGYQAGNWYLPDSLIVAGAVNFISVMRLTPLYVRQACHISDIGVSISTASAGDNLQMALYASNPTTGKPTGTALSNTPNVSTTSTGRVSGTLSSSVAVSPGLYWVAIAASTTTPQVNAWSSGAASPMDTDAGDATLGNLWSLTTSFNNGYTAPVTFNSGTPASTWSDLSAATFTASTAPAFGYKVSSVP